MSRRVHLSLGSNVGDREAHLRRAIASIEAWPEVRAVAVSPVYRTAHVGTDAHTPDYLNVCIALDGAPDPQEILRRGQDLERAAGRAANTHELPRPLDVDLLLDGTVTMEGPELTLPHPRMAERRFVLAPLADLDPTLTVTATGATVAELLARPEVAAQGVERVDVDLSPDVAARGLAPVARTRT